MASNAATVGGTTTDLARPGRIPVSALGTALAAFFMISFTLCVLLGVVVPDKAPHMIWLQFLPGFEWMSWGSYFLGLAETFVYGWYVALVFAPLYNHFATRWGR